MQIGVDTYLQNGKRIRSAPCRRLKYGACGFRGTRAALAVFSLFLTAYLTVSSQTVKRSVSASLVFCAETLVPSLFPFMIASSLLVACGFGQVCARVFAKPFGALFGSSGAGAGAFLLGSVAGFPIGAKNVCELKENGVCTASEAEALLGLCSNPGVGSCVAFIGVSMWGSAAFGVQVWVIALVSSVISGMLCKRDDAVISRDIGLSLPDADGGYTVFGTVIGAITGAVGAMLSVCGSVVFFELIGTVIASIIGMIVGGEGMAFDVITTSVAAFLEFSSGTVMIARLFGGVGGSCVGGGLAALGRVMTVAAVAWSGVSVHAQVAALAVPCGVKMSGYYRVKALTATIATLISAVLSMTLWR